ncbi:hypothetical protein EDF46_2835 [Frondihabitans sp. PhB188]|uniref:hypothetical protein n=1 Tax=Frondihabitans sp. PhB188 TaxID=2485200 RepID=UPI000FB200D2|nr:hypothetical protein [Frondihabitans sp. PhB188]ROQ37379.1 hypothetical protein EDF46_2835 [Frondihabitans sp. PhB188]
MTHPSDRAARWIPQESWACPVLAAASLILVVFDTRLSLIPLALAFALFAHLGRRAGERTEPRHALMASLPFIIAIIVIHVVRWTTA